MIGQWGELPIATYPCLRARCTLSPPAPCAQTLAGQRAFPSTLTPPNPWSHTIVPASISEWPRGMGFGRAVVGGGTFRTRPRPRGLTTAHAQRLSSARLPLHPKCSRPTQTERRRRWRRVRRARRHYLPASVVRSKASISTISRQRCVLTPRLFSRVPPRAYVCRGREVFLLAEVRAVVRARRSSPSTSGAASPQSSTLSSQRACLPRCRPLHLQSSSACWQPRC